jgi:micrococcal nuclease
LTHVIDGDTIRANVDGRDERIRLLGIDAPELGRDGEPDEKCAQEAKRFLTSWIGGSTVTRDYRPELPRARPLRPAPGLRRHVDDVDVSYVMLDDGWADLYTGNPDTHPVEHLHRGGRRTNKAPLRRS